MFKISLIPEKRDKRKNITIFLWNSLKLSHITTKIMVKGNYIRPGFCEELHNIKGYVSLNINLLLVSRSLKWPSINKSFRESTWINKSIEAPMHAISLTLTTDAPVANFFPSFFEASLSLMPEIRHMVNWLTSLNLLTNYQPPTMNVTGKAYYSPNSSSPLTTVIHLRLLRMTFSITTSCLSYIMSLLLLMHFFMRVLYKR